MHVKKVAEQVCSTCALLFCVVILCQNLKVILKDEFGIFTLGGVLLSGLIAVLAARYWNLSDRKSMIALFVIRFSISMAVILFISAVPVSDFEIMYRAAQDMANGSRDYLTRNSAYFFCFPYQTGFCFYESLILRLFGNDLLPLQIMNGIWLGGIGALVYGIAIRLMNRRAAAGISLLFALWPSPYFLAAVLTNQHLAALLFYLAVWLLVRKEHSSLHIYIVVGVLVALGNVIRPIGIIVLLATVIWEWMEDGEQLVKRQSQRAKKDTTMRKPICIVFMIASYFAVFLLCSVLIRHSGLNPYGLKNNVPMWKFVLGLNQESDGMWNQSDDERYMKYPDAATDDELREVVIERLKVEPASLASLALRKSEKMWGEYEDTSWGFGHLMQEDEKKQDAGGIARYSIAMLVRIEKGVYLAVFALFSVGMMTPWREKRCEYAGAQRVIYLLILLFCGYYSVHLMIEVQVRYRYFIMPAVFLLAGYGFERARNGLSAWTERRNVHSAAKAEIDK